VFTTGAIRSLIGQAWVMKTRLLIADDSSDYLRLLELLFDCMTDVDVVAVASNGLAAVHRACEERIDVALLDIGMPGLDGFAAAEAIRGANPRTTVVLQTGELDADVQRRADELELCVFGKFDLITNLELLLSLRSDRVAA
jgi:CheY-like chemotaxis protein